MTTDTITLDQAVSIVFRDFERAGRATEAEIRHSFRTPGPWSVEPRVRKAAKRVCYIIWQWGAGTYRNKEMAAALGCSKSTFEANYLREREAKRLEQREAASKP